MLSYAFFAHFIFCLLLRLLSYCATPSPQLLEVSFEAQQYVDLRSVFGSLLPFRNLHGFGTG